MPNHFRQLWITCHCSGDIGERSEAKDHHIFGIASDSIAENFFSGMRRPQFGNGKQGTAETVVAMNVPVIKWHWFVRR
jgi:hypothetical protein